MKSKITSSLLHVTGGSLFAIAVISSLTAGPAVASTVYVVSALVAWTLAALVAYELRPSMLDEICRTYITRKRITRTKPVKRVSALVEFRRRCDESRAA